MISITPLKWLQSDARHYQIISQLFFLIYGLFFLQWDQTYWYFIAAIIGATLTQALFIRFADIPADSMKSALITSLGICLLLKANSPWILFAAAGVSIGQKFAFRPYGYHLWNPANFGIIISIILSKGSWVSPGQWGTEAILVLVISAAGLNILSRINRNDTAIAFLLTFIGLDFFRTVIYLGWGHEVWLHRIFSGSLWLFGLFMITDPMTTPTRKSIRIIWAILVASLSFYLINFKFIPTAMQWVLFFSTPLVPVINHFTGNKHFQWLQSKKFTFKSSMLMRTLIAKFVAILTATLFLYQTSYGFCGFYVAKADASIFNNKSEVIMVRDGDTNVITMSNDFNGDVSDFAMVVPVPVVLKKEDIKIVDRKIFEYLDAYSAPRLVEYYDHNPCYRYVEESMISTADNATIKSTSRNGNIESYSKAVKIEAQYKIGHYDILILSATESTGLRDWLIQNGYKIPTTADEVLNPYIKSNMKFFVVKVDVTEFKKQGFQYLNPLQIKFDSPKFMLPIRLGMANSQGAQDMIVYALTKTGRVECTNYRTVKIPTDRKIPLPVKSEFNPFYKKLFEKTWKAENRNAVFLEYAWDVTPNWSMKCDPCVGPPPMNQELVDAGVWWGNQQTFFTRLHVRYEKSKFPSDLVFQVTPNNENFQARYVLTNPAQGDLNCEAGQLYIDELSNRRKIEVDEYSALTGTPFKNSSSYIHEFKKQNAIQYQKNGFLSEVSGSLLMKAISLILFTLFILTFFKKKSPL